MSLGKESASARNAESFCQSKHVLDNNNEALRDGPLENLWGGGGVNEKKIHARQSTLKNIHATA